MRYLVVGAWLFCLWVTFVASQQSIPSDLPTNGTRAAQPAETAAPKLGEALHNVTNVPVSTSGTHTLDIGYFDPILDPFIGEDDRSDPGHLIPKKTHTLHYLKDELLHGGFVNMSFHKNAVKLEDSSLILHEETSCSAQSNHVNVSLVVSSSDAADAVTNWDVNDTLVILWGPHGSGCEEYRQPYHLTAAPSSTCTGNGTYGVFLKLFKVTFKGEYSNLYLRIAPAANFPDSSFTVESVINPRRLTPSKTSPQSPSSASEMGKRIDITASPSWNFNHQKTEPLTLNDPSEGILSGYASISGSITLDLELSAGFDGPNPQGYTVLDSTISASVGAGYNAQAEGSINYSENRHQLLNEVLVNFGIKDLATSSSYVFVDLTTNIYVAPGWTVNNLGPTFGWNNANLRFILNLDESSCGPGWCTQFSHSDWTPTLGSNPSVPYFTYVKSFATATGGPGAGWCYDISFVDNIFDYSWCTRGDLTGTTSVGFGDAGCNALQFNAGASVDVEFTGSHVSTEPIYQAGEQNIINECHP